MENSGINVQCNPHPDAPHGFLRDASHNEGRYVCECEFWEPQEHMRMTFDASAPVTITPHPYFHKRTWVGLTDEEIDTAWRSVDYTVLYEQFRIDIARAIEAKLKEKNG